VRFAPPIVGILGLIGVFAVGPASAPAEPLLPIYSGLLDFSTIKGPSDPEEYSWKVKLVEGQELKAVDDQLAEVYFEDGTPMMKIEARPAHDADGASVPTSLRISEGDIVTLIVHHRDGNPAAEGAPFAYPILGGKGWEVGPSVVIVVGPKDEQELREERERVAREEWEAAQVAERGPTRDCLVPRLKGESLKTGRRKLRRAGCRLGEVRGPGSKTAKVVKQNPKAGATLAAGAEVGVKIGG
jgi:hypothetical protein